MPDQGAPRPAGAPGVARSTGGAEPGARAGSSPASPADGSWVGEERVVSSRVLHRGRYLTFRVDTVERADGSRAERDICGHPGAVAILALDAAERLLLVRQFRLAAGRALLEIPAGTLEVADDGTVEDPELAAVRELEEETGQRAERWTRLATFWTAPGFATEAMHLYLASGLITVREQLGEDDDERLELVRLPVEEALAMTDDGRIEDAKTLVGLLWLDRLRRRGRA